MYIYIRYVCVSISVYMLRATQPNEFSNKKKLPRPLMALVKRLSPPIIVSRTWPCVATVRPPLRPFSSPCLFEITHRHNTIVKFVGPLAQRRARPGYLVGSP